MVHERARASFGRIPTFPAAALAVAGIAGLAHASGGNPAQQSARVSVSSTDAQADLGGVAASISWDGRYVAFESRATNLVAGDTNGDFDVFVRDGQTGATERVSVSTGGAEGNGDSLDPTISSNGRFVVFDSAASNLVSGDGNGVFDVFLRDLRNGTTERVSVDSTGKEGNDASRHPAVSMGGRYVAFVSSATNLVSGDSNGVADVFVRDRQTGTTERVSVDSSGNQSDGASTSCSISSDGRFVAFASVATDLVSGDTNGTFDVFVRDRQNGTTERVSVDSSGGQGDAASLDPSLSADGMLVAFDSAATNLVSGDGNGRYDVFLHDRASGVTGRVSVDSNGTEGDDSSWYPALSGDGHVVAFQSLATNLVANDNNARYDVFTHDVVSGTTERVSVDSNGSQANDVSDLPAISSDGRFVAFESGATDLVTGDTNSAYDVFVHGPYLTLETSPPSPPAGVKLTFETWTGMPLGQSLLALVDVNGTQTFLPVTIMTFDPNGMWVTSAYVPPGLKGNDFTFQSYGYVETGAVEASNQATVAFQ
jgi:hypothetical protein